MIPIRVTKTVWSLIGVSLFLFIVQKVCERFLGVDLVGIIGLLPQAVLHGAVWQLFTYMFLHGDVGHLILNLLMLAFIGSELEAVWGRRRFLTFYFFCGLIAALHYLFLQVLFAPSNYPMVGASGGIYGLLMAYGLLFGERVLLFMMLFPMKAKHFIWVLAGVEFLTGLFSSSPGSGWSSVAHLGGMLGGSVYLYAKGWWLVRRKRKGSRSPQGSRKSGKSHLQLVTKEGDEPRTWH